MSSQKLCFCGSNKPRRALKDAANIFLCFVCDDCAKQKKAGYNPAIFNERGTYAQTGNEEDIDNDPKDY